MGDEAGPSPRLVASMSMALRYRSLFATRRSRTISFAVAVAAVGLGAALLTKAAPTGLGTADPFWSGVLVAVIAVFGATARRWTWFLPAGVAAVVAGDGLATLLAAVAIAIAFFSVVTDTRSRARGAVVVGLGAIALLRAEPIGFHGLTALLMVAVGAAVVASGYGHAGRRVQARTRRLALIGAGVLGLMLVGAALGVISVQSDLAAGAHGIDGGLAAARQADDDTAAEQLAQAARSLTAANGTLSSWFVAPARTLPIVGPNLTAVGALASQASEVANVTSLAADSADVDNLRFVDGRLDPKAVGDMLQPLQDVQAALRRMDTSVDQVRSPWLLTPVTNRIDRLHSQIAVALPDTSNAINAVSIGPTLLGEDGPQRYLVVFTTPVEARGRIGFPGNFAELEINDGKLSMPRFGRISELEKGGVPGAERKIIGPLDYLRRYSRFDVKGTWRNLTMTPDFVSFAQAAGQLYPQSGGTKIQGVLAVDPQGLAAIMRYTGPVRVEGLDEPLTSANAAQFLEFDQYKLFTDNSRRTDVLEAVARTTFDRLTAASLPGPRALSDQLSPAVDGGHIMFTTLDADTAVPLAAAGVNGQLPGVRPDRDMVTVTTSNAAGNKLDLFMHRAERYDVHWDPDTGDVKATLHVRLDNAAPATGLPDYVAGNAVGLPKGTNRSFVSIYTPFELDGAKIGGKPTALQSETELDRHVYSTFVDIPAGKSVDIELDLSGHRTGRRYRLDLPAQPFATADTAELHVTVGGHGPLAASADTARVRGRTVSWLATIDQPRTLSVSTPHD